MIITSIGLIIIYGMERRVWRVRAEGRSAGGGDGRGRSARGDVSHTS